MDYSFIYSFSFLEYLPNNDFARKYPYHPSHSPRGILINAIVFLIPERRVVSYALPIFPSGETLLLAKSFVPVLVECVRL